MESLSFCLVADAASPEEPVKGAVFQRPADGTARHLVVLCRANGCETNTLRREGGGGGEGGKEYRGREVGGGRVCV